MAAPMVIPDTGSIQKAVSLINTIDTGRFSRLLSRILQKLHLKAESTFTEEEEEKLKAAFSVEKQDLHLVLETITFILEQAVYHNLKPAILKQQLEHSSMDPDKAEMFASAWAAAGPQTVEKFRQRIFSPQKLETVGWQLNLQMAQSTQAKQKSPQAVLELGVNNEDSKVTMWAELNQDVLPLSVYTCEMMLFAWGIRTVSDISLTALSTSLEQDPQNWNRLELCFLLLQFSIFWRPFAIT